MKPAKWQNIYTRANAGRWVAVNKKTGRVIARGKDLATVDIRACTKVSEDLIVLVRVPREVGL